MVFVRAKKVAKELIQTVAHSTRKGKGRKPISKENEKSCEAKKLPKCRWKIVLLYLCRKSTIILAENEGKQKATKRAVMGATRIEAYEPGGSIFHNIDWGFGWAWTSISLSSGPCVSTALLIFFLYLPLLFLLTTFSLVVSSSMGQVFRRLINALYTKKLEVVLVGLENRLITFIDSLSDSTVSRFPVSLLWSLSVLHRKR